MKHSILVILCALVASTDALTQPTISTTGRRAFLAKTVTAAATIAAASPALAISSDPYALDLDESYKKEIPKKTGGNGGALVGGVFGGGLLLSLPFFAPNLARMAGIKNAKLKK